MKNSCIGVAAIVAVTALAASSAWGSITIPTVAIGNAGNAADPTTGFGSVAYGYNIGTTEVTNEQYAAFLNATAKADPRFLYNTNMWISRSGSNGSYIYEAVPGRASHPVNYVSFWDATRFANWLHNGQGSGDTETGAYSLTSGGISANTITRNAGAQWAVTSEDEWYKAAYHQPASAGGDADDYWLYPTSSDDVPTTAQANFGNVNGDTKPVSSYAANYYGTFDMGGNVVEWNEAILFGFARGLRGGAFAFDEDILRADSRNDGTPGIESVSFGFRVSQVPGPSSVALLAIGGIAALRRRR
jgi:MYXO-CTERM domain-containing protein